MEGNRRPVLATGRRLLSGRWGHRETGAHGQRACYRAHAFADALEPDIKHKRIRPYRPQSNGKVERFSRTMLVEWTYARPYRLEAERLAVFPDWSDYYNHRRGYTAPKGLAPAGRVHDLRG